MPAANTFLTQQLIGPYAVGAKPAALQVTMTDSAGTVLDLTGYSVTTTIIKVDDTAGTVTLAQGTTAAPTPSNGVVQYQWHADDFAEAGMYRLVIWAGNGTNRYPSDLFDYTVQDTGVTVPSI